MQYNPAMTNTWYFAWHANRFGATLPRYASWAAWAEPSLSARCRAWRDRMRHDATIADMRSQVAMVA